MITTTMATMATTAMMMIHPAFPLLTALSLPLPLQPSPDDSNSTQHMAHERANALHNERKGAGRGFQAGRLQLDVSYQDR